MENNIYIRKENYKALKWWGFKIKHFKELDKEFLRIDSFKKEITPQDEKIYLVTFKDELKTIQMLLAIITLVMMVLSFVDRPNWYWYSLVLFILLGLQFQLVKSMFSMKEVEYIENDFLEINPLIDEYKIKS